MSLISNPELHISLRLLLPLTAELLALCLTRGSLRRYCIAQSLATVATFFGEDRYGLNSNAYRVIYVSATSLVVASLFAIAWEAGARLVWITTGLSSCFYGYLVQRKHVWTLDFSIVLVETVALLTVAFTLGIRFAATRDRNHVILSFMFMLFATYDAHWLVNVHIPIFEYLCPTYLVVVGCLWLARHNYAAAAS